MTANERNELLRMLVRDFIILTKEHLVWAREDASSVLIARGKLIGACMALELDYTETDATCYIKTRGSRPRTLVSYNKPDIPCSDKEGPV